MNHSATHRTTPARFLARAFTLYELLTVLAIVGILLAILLPTLASARRAAQTAATQTFMRDIAIACNQFQLDNNGTNPGRFTPAEMASTENDARGFSTMQNILLDLVGGEAKDLTDTAAIQNVGPLSDVTRRLIVNPNLIGSNRPGGKAYLILGSAQLATQNAPGRVATGVLPAHTQIPDVIDYFKTPIIAWVADDRAPTSPNAHRQFATLTSQNEIARYYWSSNRTYLGQGGPQTASMLYQLRNDDPRRYTMTGVLGNPSFPELPNIVGPRVPSQSRGQIVFHSAGRNGIFVGSEERGGKIAAAAAGGSLAAAQVQFTPSVDPMSNGDFDDVIVSSGN